MTQPTTDSQPAADDREATKHPSRRLLWRLVAVLVFVVVSTLAVIGYRIHRRYRIWILITEDTTPAITPGGDYPRWMWDRFGNYMIGLDSIKYIGVRDSPTEHFRLIKELNPEELDWFRSEESGAVYRLPLEGGRQIREMTRLKTLDLYDWSDAAIDGLHVVVSEEFLAEIARSPSLQTIKLGYVKLQGSPFTALSGSNTIQSIVLNECSYPEADLRQLKNLKSLKSLTLRGNPVMERSMFSLAEVTQLEELTLEYVEVPLSCIQRLQNLEHLRSLKMNQIGSLTGIRFSDFECLPNLKTLDLSYTNFDDLDVQELAGANQLKSLNLRSTLITDPGLRLLHTLHQLETLDLSNTRVTDDAIEKFKTAVPGCRVDKEELQYQ